ncbi:MAG: hypothetical protein PHS37_06315 [Candidatus Omnitrophica bacterium]|nr:hypothetical protein [Candidatus Omnitrophota bacterium]
MVKKNALGALVFMIWCGATASAYQFEDYRWGTPIDAVKKELDEKHKTFGDDGTYVSYFDTVADKPCEVKFIYTPKTHMLSQVQVIWTNMATGGASPDSVEGNPDGYTITTAEYEMTLNFVNNLVDILNDEYGPADDILGAEKEYRWTNGTETDELDDMTLQYSSYPVLTYYGGQYYKQALEEAGILSGRTEERL